jgi:hypothetical protein
MRAARSAFFSGHYRARNIGAGDRNRNLFLWRPNSRILLRIRQFMTTSSPVSVFFSISRNGLCFFALLKALDFS